MLYLAEKFQTFAHVPRLEKLYLWPETQHAALLIPTLLMV